MRCTQCGNEFEGKFCSNCGAAMPQQSVINASPINEQTVSQKKRIYNHWWFWVIVTVVAIEIIMRIDNRSIFSSNTAVKTGSTNVAAQSKEKEQLSDKQQTENKEQAKEVKKVKVIDFSSMSKSEIKSWASKNGVKCTFTKKYSSKVDSGKVISQSKEENETVDEGSTIKIVISKGKKPKTEYLNALKKAEIYSEQMHLSKRRIYLQLTSEYGEKFSADAAQYAIDHLDADYKKNALAKAKEYQENLSMSKSAIYTQLISDYGERFTKKEAQYAIDLLDD